jgi:hypothetical protein
MARRLPISPTRSTNLKVLGGEVCPSVQAGSMLPYLRPQPPSPLHTTSLSTMCVCVCVCQCVCVFVCVSRRSCLCQLGLCPLTCRLRSHIKHDRVPGHAHRTTSTTHWHHVLRLCCTSSLVVVYLVRARSPLVPFFWLPRKQQNTTTAIQDESS